MEFLRVVKIVDRPRGKITFLVRNNTLKEDRFNKQKTLSRRPKREKAPFFSLFSTRDYIILI